MSDSRTRTLFKLTKPPDGLTRRVLFGERPTWSQLAAKIFTLYAIPKENVGVSYVDADGDEVTLSSNEELQDFYRYNEASSEPDSSSGNTSIKFAVRDITVTRDWDSSQTHSHTPHSSTRRNTFGAFPTMVYEMADDWQRVPSLGGDFRMMVGTDGSESPHAFVEVLDSDVSITKDNDKDDTSTVTQSEMGDMASKVDKGKGKAKSADVISFTDYDDASTVSMVDEHAPHKPPVHVAGASDVSNNGKPSSPRESSTISRRSTPKPAPLNPAAEDAAPDPPLPDLNADGTASASLTADVANLINALSTVFASHPELSEGVRNIVRGATSGVYWNTHRRAVAAAAEEIRRSAYNSAEDIRRAAESSHRATEEAAGRRIAEAISNVVRVIGETVQNATGSAGAEPWTSTPVTARPAGPSAAGVPSRPRSPSRRETWGGSFTPFDRPRGMYGNIGLGRNGTFDDRFYQDFARHQRRPRRPPTPPSPLEHEPHRQYAPPPPPPPPNRHPGPPPPPPPPPRPPMFGPFSQSIPPLPSHPHPPPPPAFTNVPPMPLHQPRPRTASFDYLDHSSDPFFSERPWETHATRTRGTVDRSQTVFGDIHTAPRPAPIVMSRSVSQETRDRLEAAKEAYKVEKEKYRLERQERRKEKEQNMSDEARPLVNSSETRFKKDGGISMSTSAGSSIRTVHAPAVDGESVTHIVSNARGPYPQLEMINVTPPRRHHTVQGFSRSRRTTGDISGPSRIFNGSFPSPSQPSSVVRAGDLIKAKLADMGFTSDMHPDISKKIASRLSLIVTDDRDDLPREAEDDIVSEVVEELLTANVDKDLPPQPTSTVATSGPGEWRN